SPIQFKQPTKPLASVLLIRRFTVRAQQLQLICKCMPKLLAHSRSRRVCDSAMTSYGWNSETRGRKLPTQRARSQLWTRLCVGRLTTLTRIGNAVISCCEWKDLTKPSLNFEPLLLLIEITCRT